VPTIHVFHSLLRSLTNISRLQVTTHTRHFVHCHICCVTQVNVKTECSETGESLRNYVAFATLHTQDDMITKPLKMDSLVGLHFWSTRCSRKAATRPLQHQMSSTHKNGQCKFRTYHQVN
jgi:hypothetical protein